jgi:hypothetical protein
MAAGLLLAVMALFMAPMSLREVCTAVNRVDFVRDEIGLDFFYKAAGGHSSDWLDAHIVSTSERFHTDRTHLLGLGLDELRRNPPQPGLRAPVWYLPPHRFWSTVDGINAFRVMAPVEFDQGFPEGLFAANLVIAVAAILLIRRGAGWGGRSPRGA